MASVVKPVNSGYTYFYGTCTGNAPTIYDFWLEYYISGTSVTLKSYLQRNDGFSSGITKLSGVSKVLTCDDINNTVTGALDTRNSALVLLHSYTFTAVSGSITIGASFTGTGSTALTGASASRVITVGSKPTSVSTSLSGNINSGVGQGNITSTITDTGAFGGGTVNYLHQWHLDGTTTWSNSGWTTNNTSIYSMPSTTYPEGRIIYFKSSAKNTLGQTDSSEITLKVNSLPNTPGSILVDSNRPITQVIISWTTATDLDSQTIVYELEQRINYGTWATTNITSSNSFIYNITSVNQGTPFNFRVRAKDSLGAYSGYCTLAETIYKATFPNTPIIASNSGEIAEDIASLTANATSTYGNGEIKYKFAYCTSINATWIEDTSYSSSNTKNYDISISKGVTWSFKVKASNNVGESSWSEIIYIKSNSRPSLTNFIAQFTSSKYDEIQVSWDKPTDDFSTDSQLEMTLELTKDEETEFLELYNPAQTNIFLLDTLGDLPGTTYKFTMRVKELIFVSEEIFSIFETVELIKGYDFIEAEPLGYIEAKINSSIKKLYYYPISSIGYNVLRTKTHKGIGVFPLVELNDKFATGFRMKTQNGIKALAIYNKVETMILSLNETAIDSTYMRLEIVANTTPSDADYSLSWDIDPYNVGIGIAETNKQYTLDDVPYGQNYTITCTDLYSNIQQQISLTTMSNPFIIPITGAGLTDIVSDTTHKSTIYVPISEKVYIYALALPINHTETVVQANYAITIGGGVGKYIIISQDITKTQISCPSTVNQHGELQLTLTIRNKSGTIIQYVCKTLLITASI